MKTHQSITDLYLGNNIHFNPVSNHAFAGFMFLIHDEKPDEH